MQMQHDPIGVNKQIVARFYRAFNAHDPGYLDSVLDPGWRVHPEGQYPGRKGWEPGLLALYTAFPDIQVTIQEIICEGDFVAVRAQFTGTHEGTFLQLPPTHRRVTFDGHDIHRLRGGLIYESWHVEDWLTVFGQLGESPHF